MRTSSETTLAQTTSQSEIKVGKGNSIESLTLTQYTKTVEEVSAL